MAQPELGFFSSETRFIFFSQNSSERIKSQKKILTGFLAVIVPFSFIRTSRLATILIFLVEGCKAQNNIFIMNRTMMEMDSAIDELVVALK